MALSDIDRNLLQRCLAMRTNAWEDFVDRFLGLVIHVISHSAQCRSLRLSSEDREDLTESIEKYWDSLDLEDKDNDDMYLGDTE